MTADKGLELNGRGTPKSSVFHVEPKIGQLLSDIEPFFHGRALIYVDVGAHHGDIFREVHASSLTLQAAHLIEPNPTSFATLEATVQELGVAATTVCRNVALAARPQRVRLHDAGTMTKVIGAPDNPENADGRRSFDVEATTLDVIVQALPRPHISILKVDVEGYECEVFAGATTLLGSQAVDLIYVEAGIDPAGTQQTYYRDIEDILRSYGYRLFRIYEQTHQWLEDSPFLRRVNLAFLSGNFAASNPYRLSRKLFAAHAEGRALKEALAEAEARLSITERELASLSAALEEVQTSGTVRGEELDRLEASYVEAIAKRDAALANVQQRLEAQADEVEELKARLAIRSKELAQLTETLEASRNEVRSLQIQIDSVLNSTSWRLLRPARSIVTMVRGGR